MVITEDDYGNISSQYGPLPVLPIPFATSILATVKFKGLSNNRLKKHLKRVEKTGPDIFYFLTQTFVMTSVKQTKLLLVSLKGQDSYVSLTI